MRSAAFSPTPDNGPHAPDSHKFRVFTAGQKRRVTPAIKRQMRRRSAIEPVIGHIKAEHRMDRNHLAGEQDDAVSCSSGQAKGHRQRDGRGRLPAVTAWRVGR